MLRLPDAICWHEGMQLLPQHFQLQGLRAEGVSALLAGLCNPCYWGVLSIDIDAPALASGIVRINAIEAVFPDGTPVDFRAGDSQELKLDLRDPSNHSEEDILTVYLAIEPLWQAGRIVPLAGRLASSLSEPIPDLATGGFETNIKVWRPKLRLIAKDLSSDAVCIPLLKLSQESGGFVQHLYIPPTPFIAPESSLGQRVQALCTRAREKCLHLAAKINVAHQSAEAEEVSKLSQQLFALWSRLPEVEAALNSRAATPDRLYGLLAGLAGSWSLFDLVSGVPAFSPLKFTELLKSYDEVLDWLNKTLERVRAGHKYIAFDKEGSGFYVSLPTDLNERLVIGLRMPPGCSASSALDWLNKTIIASEQYVPILHKGRISGLKYKIMSARERLSYSVGDEFHLFIIESQSEWFEANQRFCLVAPFMAGQVTPAQIILVLNPEKVSE